MIFTNLALYLYSPDYGVCIPCKIIESKAKEVTNVVQSKVGSFIRKDVLMTTFDRSLM